MSMRLVRTVTDMATIEHLNFDKPFYVKYGLMIEDIVICCSACNSSRGVKRLWDWFKSAYCRERNINPDTLAEPVRKYLCGFPPGLKQFVESAPWIIAKTNAETSPHESLAKDQCDKTLFESLARHIRCRGYGTEPIYFDYGEHTYWKMPEVINRRLKSEERPNL
jgi:hypothetical protein